MDKQTAQLAAWDQIERDLAERLNHFSDADLLRMVESLDDRSGPITPREIMLSGAANILIAFPFFYEHRRRNGGFGRGVTRRMRM